MQYFFLNVHLLFVNYAVTCIFDVMCYLYSPCLKKGLNKLIISSQARNTAMKDVQIGLFGKHVSCIGVV